MKCIAIDDEPLALEIIKNYSDRISFITLVGSFTNVLEAIDFMHKNVVDLIFLDIQMPHITGFQFINSLSNPPMIIFTTAYPDYALEGFEVNAVDYLLKPFSFDRFLKGVQKAYDLYLIKTQKQNQISLSDEPQSFLLVKSDYSIVKVDIDKIEYIEGLKDYVKIYKGDPRPILSKMTMKNLEEKLPPDKFVRIHKSYIVSLDYIDIIENNRVKIKDKYKVIKRFLKKIKLKI